MATVPHAATMFAIDAEELTAKLDDASHTKEYRTLKGSVHGIHPDVKLPGHPYARVLDPTMLATSNSQVRYMSPTVRPIIVRPDNFTTAILTGLF